VAAAQHEQGNARPHTNPARNEANDADRLSRARRGVQLGYLLGERVIVHAAGFASTLLERVVGLRAFALRAQAEDRAHTQTHCADTERDIGGDALGIRSLVTRGIRSRGWLGRGRRRARWCRSGRS